MQTNLVRKLKTLAFICLVTCFAGVIYQLISEQRLDFDSVMVGFPLGLVFGLLELFVFPKAEKRFRQWPFTKMFIFKALFYTAVIYIVALSIAFLSGVSHGRDISELAVSLKSREPWILIFYTLVVYSL